MNKLDISVLEKIQAWRAQNLNVVLITVAQTWGSSPRPRGSMLAWCENGQFVGSVSGGCIEDDLLQEFSESVPTRVSVKDYGVSAERAASRGLPCGGRLSLVIEPLTSRDDSQMLLEAIGSRKSIKRSLNLNTGSVTHKPANPSDRTELQDDTFHAVFAAEWRLFIIGAGELGQFVNQFASALGFMTAVCDPRENYRQSWAQQEIPVHAGMPDDFIASANCDERTAVVALTHDPKIDDLAILEALGSKAFYVGALGSTRTTNARRKRLSEHFDISAEQLNALHGPIGIDLNTRSAAEIALAIVTEIVATRNGVTLTAARC